MYSTNIETCLVEFIDLIKENDDFFSKPCCIPKKLLLVLFTNTFNELQNNVKNLLKKWEEKHSIDTTYFGTHKKIEDNKLKLEIGSLVSL